MTNINPRRVETSIIMSLTESEQTTSIILEMGFRGNVGERLRISLAEIGSVVGLLRKNMVGSDDATAVESVSLEREMQTICMRCERGIVAVWCFGLDRHFCLSIKPTNS